MLVSELLEDGKSFADLASMAMADTRTVNSKPVAVSEKKARPNLLQQLMTKKS